MLTLSTFIYVFALRTYLNFLHCLKYISRRSKSHYFNCGFDIITYMHHSNLLKLIILIHSFENNETNRQ